jgi:hypothetical protein
VDQLYYGRKLVTPDSIVHLGHPALDEPYECL